MNLFEINKTIKRLEAMIDNAINDNEIETIFDESKVSALESKLNRYLLMTKTKSTQMEEEKTKIKELISDISHQTKTPIANLILYSSLLLEQNELSDQCRKMIKEIDHQSKKLNFLISSLVKTSRLEIGIISVNPSKISINPMIDDVIGQIKPHADKKSIDILYESKDIPAIFDYKWTCEALYNIVDNAVKYTDCGGVITISVTKYEMFCRIDIRDIGIGVAEHEQNKIFKRFYRSMAVTHVEGVGLGLYLTREIIEHQGGYIKLSSQLQKGSTFSVFLPL